MDEHLCRALTPIWAPLWSLIGAKSQETRRRREAARRGDEWNVWPDSEYLWTRRDFPAYPRLCKFMILILAYPGICKFWKLILAYPGLSWCKSRHFRQTYPKLSWDIPFSKTCTGIFRDIPTCPAGRFSRCYAKKLRKNYAHYHTCKNDRLEMSGYPGITQYKFSEMGYPRITWDTRMIWVASD